MQHGVWLDVQLQRDLARRNGCVAEGQVAERLTSLDDARSLAVGAKFRNPQAGPAREASDEGTR